MLAVQYGAGKIGRGFLAQLYARSEFETVFVEARPEIVESLNRHKSCWIEWTDGERETIAPVSALNASDIEAVAEAFARCAVASTAVGLSALPSLAPLVAAGVRRRAAVNPQPLNLLLGENAVNADAVLRDALLQTLNPDEHHLLNLLGLVRCIIGRQAVAEIPGDPPGVRVDRYSKLPVDADALVGEPPPIVGLQPVRPFEIYMQRKLYLHNGLHALIAYLGAQRGYRTIQQALQDAEIHALFVQGANALARAFLKRHPFDTTEHYETVQDILQRIQDPHLDDPIARVAREPLRKLRPDDRLVGAYTLLVEQGENPTPFRKAILAALAYNDPNDPESQQLQQMIREHGAESVLREWCQMERL
ncbi:MAG: mannitol-1-phosphate 5-dehydrogenase [Fimbriimonadales bacterium]|nr:MAG: mannitol-1-phosphate 5-dehydrogenase [Fimbriimonadales bacterium]